MPRGAVRSTDGTAPSPCPRLTGMSGRDPFCEPRRLCRGAALTLVFASVLAAGAATGSFSDDTAPAHRGPRARAPRPSRGERRPGRRGRHGRRQVPHGGRRARRQPQRRPLGRGLLPGRVRGVRAGTRRPSTPASACGRARERDGRIEVTRVAARLARRRGRHPRGRPAALRRRRPRRRPSRHRGRRVTARPAEDAGADAGSKVDLGLERGTRSVEPRPCAGPASPPTP